MSRPRCDFYRRRLERRNRRPRNPRRVFGTSKENGEAIYVRDSVFSHHTHSSILRRIPVGLATRKESDGILSAACYRHLCISDPLFITRNYPRESNPLLNVPI